MSIGPSGERARSSERCGIAVAARIRVLSVWYDVELIDLSMSGYRYASQYRFAPDQRALLKLDTFETMGGVIIWHGAGVGGVKFDRPLHASVVATIAARHPGIAVAS